MPRSKGPRSVHLRRDSQTPFGAIWSCFATPEEEETLSTGEIADEEHRLNVGDIINVRSGKHQRRTFSLLVVNRVDGRVAMRKVRD